MNWCTSSSEAILLMDQMEIRQKKQKQNKTKHYAYVVRYKGDKRNSSIVVSLAMKKRRKLRKIK